jgi:hypothetical protein
MLRVPRGEYIHPVGVGFEAALKHSRRSFGVSTVETILLPYDRSILGGSSLRTNLALFNHSLSRYVLALRHIRPLKQPPETLSDNRMPDKTSGGYIVADNHPEAAKTWDNRGSLKPRWV